MPLPLHFKGRLIHNKKNWLRPKLPFGSYWMREFLSTMLPLDLNLPLNLVPMANREWCPCIVFRKFKTAMSLWKYHIVHIHDIVSRVAPSSLWLSWWRCVTRCSFLMKKLCHWYGYLVMTFQWNIGNVFLGLCRQPPYCFLVTAGTQRLFESRLWTPAQFLRQHEPFKKALPPDKSQTPCL